jgi:hypothetical protein
MDGWLERDNRSSGEQNIVSDCNRDTQMPLYQRKERMSLNCSATTTVVPAAMFYVDTT